MLVSFIMQKLKEVSYVRLNIKLKYMKGEKNE